MKEPVGFIGLGNMGLGMAKNLLKAGFPVVGFDIRPEALKQLQESGGHLVKNPLEVAKKQEYRFSWF